MTKKIPNYYFSMRNIGYYDINIILRDIYYLGSIFFASKKWKSLGNIQPINWVKYEQTEAVSYLLSVSIKLRYLIDNKDLKLLNMILCNKVGTIEMDGKTKYLTLRDATNKIIHSSSLGFPYNWTPKTKEHLSDFVVLAGIYNKSKWAAFINIDEFIKSSLRLIDNYLKK